MKLTSVTLVFASLLLAGSLAIAAQAPQVVTPTTSTNDEAALAIFASESPGCQKTQVPSEMVFAADGDPSCGLCSAPACQGASWLAYCGTRFGNNMYCQPTQMCTGEGMGKYRCVCVVSDPILP